MDPTAWITDDVIDFAVTNDLAVTTHNVQFVQASVVVAMANAQSAGPAITAPIVLLPVSRDNLHWSLLVYDVEQSKCFHYDSLKSQNKAYVANLVGVLKQSNWLPSDATFVEVEGLTQKDEYNCGMFVIELMERIAQAGNANLPPEYLRDALSSDICNKRRQALLARLCERDVFKPQPVSPRDPCRPEAGLQRDLRGPLWSKIFTALRAEKAQWKEVYLEFERSGRFKQLVFDDFIPEYETFYQDYLKRKAIMANALKLRPLGSESRRKTWPALRHSLHESLDRKKYILRPKAYYKE
ncbi:MAG: C48 family peptidase, partial [Polyangiaceae bacterium]|nr:C48 family peptidase [Polyangiaceae bacterium]